MTQIYKEFTLDELKSFKDHILELPDTPVKPTILEDVENEIKEKECEHLR